MRMNIAKLFFKMCKLTFTGILAFAILINIIGIIKKVFLKEQIPLVFGYGNAVIITGSMEPAISPGDLIIIHKQDSYMVGDIVIYSAATPVTHRITEITTRGYITRGDANNIDDGEISRDRIIGKIVKIIPNAGNVILFFQEPLGMLILITGLFAVIEVPRLFAKTRRDIHNQPAKQP